MKYAVYLNSLFQRKIRSQGPKWLRQHWLPSKDSGYPRLTTIFRKAAFYPIGTEINTDKLFWWDPPVKYCGWCVSSNNQTVASLSRKPFLTDDNWSLTLICSRPNAVHVIPLSRFI